MWWRRSATDVVDALREGEVAPIDLVREVRARIEAVDGRLNAVVIPCFDRAERQASSASVARKSPLHGLPIVVKDTIAVKGVRFTSGSTIHRDHVADADDPVVTLLVRNGAVTTGKSNTPEFALGANTYNRVFGETITPFNAERRYTCGGSSGGSAAAVAAGEAWGGVGSDLGGSLRIPAAFCGVVGMRPTPGIVPTADIPAGAFVDLKPGALHSVNGPIARTVEDCALLLDAMTPGPPRYLPGVRAAAAHPQPSRRVVFSPVAMTMVGLHP